MKPNSLQAELEDTTKGIRLSAWYLNTRRIAAATGVDIGVEAQKSISQNSAERADQMHHAMRLAQNMVSSGRIPNLTKSLLAASKYPGRIFASTWATFSFRGLGAAIGAERDRKKPKDATFSGEIYVGSDVLKASGTLYTEHVYSHSCVGYLSGRKRAYIAGYFDFANGPENVEISPIIIGEFISEFAASPFRWRWPDNSRIYIEDVPAFKKVGSVRTPTIAQLEALKNVPEERIKSAFAEIIGEPFVPKDWAGEKSDLYTSRLSVGEKPVAAAFLLKGPAIFRPMYPADLGKRGDQLVRLFDEPADLLVLQHCHKVETSVIRQMEALAVQPNKPRMYSVIDGAETYRILKAYKYL